MEKIEIYLQEFGLSENETKLYLALLRNGASTVLDLAKATKLNRTTVHVTIENLVQKGMATQLKHGARRQIIAEPPEKLKLIFEQEKLKIAKKEEILPDLIKSIGDSVINIRQNTESEVRYYEGRDAVARVYDEILSFDQVRTYVNASLLEKFLPENQEKFVNAVKLKGKEIWDLQDYKYRHSAFIDLAKAYKKYHLKCFPSHVKIYGMDYLIYGDYVTIVQGGDDISAIVIKSKALAENSKVMYDLMWKLLP